jgi:hypothetical protein
MQDPVATEGQLVPQCPKCYCMPKEVLDLSLSLHGLTSNSAMRHIHLQSDASLAWNSRNGHPLGCLILIESQLKNGLNTWYSVVKSTDPNALPPLNTPYKVNVYPHALPMVVPSMNPLVTWRVHYSEKRRTLWMHYTGISFCMCRHPRGELIGCWTCLETKWGLASPYRCIVVCQMSSQSSRREWAQTRLSLGITNDPWLWLYMISRGYSVLCVKTSLYFLMFIKLPVKGIHCVIIVARTVNAKTEFIIIHVVHYQIACRLSYYISYIMVMAYQEFWYQLLVIYHTIHGNSLRWKFWQCKFQQKMYSK